MFQISGFTYTKVPISDENVDYNVKIFLKSDHIEMGLFNDYEMENNEPTGQTEYSVSGICESKLVELEKYGFDNTFEEKYSDNGNINIDGVDYNESIENEIIYYYISGIKYVDDLINGITYYSFNSGDFVDNFVNNSYVKLYARDGFSDQIINNNIFIERQSVSAFEGNIKLENLTNIIRLETYAGGRYFDIIK